MPTMPYWLAKTPEMVAMDRWFSLEDAVDEGTLIERYQNAIHRIMQRGNDVFTGHANTLDHRLNRGPNAPASSFAHFDADWLNLLNTNSGGNFWPQIPTWYIVARLQRGVKYALQKALGVNNQPTPVDLVKLFAYEADIDPADNHEGVVGLVSCWVCTGSTGFEVDAVRGPTAVQLVITTPPPYAKPHNWEDVQADLDTMWLRIHSDTGLPDPPADRPPPEDPPPGD